MVLAKEKWNMLIQINVSLCLIRIILLCFVLALKKSVQNKQFSSIFFSTATQLKNQLFIQLYSEPQLNSFSYSSQQQKCQVSHDSR